MLRKRKIQILNDCDKPQVIPSLIKKGKKTKMGNLENLLKCSQSCKSTCHEINKEEERVNIEG